MNYILFFILTMLNLFKKTKTQKEDIVIQLSDKQTIQLYTQIPEFTNWNKNRPPDVTRINELKEYYISEKVKFIPGIIYAWDNDSSLQIYDGIHRLLAANELLNEYENLEFTFLMCIYKTQYEDLIIKDFKAINKSCPVPSLYTDDQNELSLIKRVVCENVVGELCKKYQTNQNIDNLSSQNYKKLQKISRGPLRTVMSVANYCELCGNVLQI